MKVDSVTVAGLAIVGFLAYLLVPKRASAANPVNGYDRPPAGWGGGGGGGDTPGSQLGGAGSDPAAPTTRPPREPTGFPAPGTPPAAEGAPPVMPGGPPNPTNIRAPRSADAPAPQRSGAMRGNPTGPASPYFQATTPPTNQPPPIPRLHFTMTGIRRG